MTEEHPDCEGEQTQPDVKERIRSSSPMTNRRKFMGLVGAGAAIGMIRSGSTAAAARHKESFSDEEGEGELGSFSVQHTSYQLDSHIYGGLTEPEVDTDRSHIGFVFIHPEHDFTRGWRNQVAERHGYHALGVNAHSRIRGMFTVSELLPDLGMAVRFLRDMDEIEHVILGGHSGGAHLSSLYQNVAENGVETGQGDEKIVPLPDYLHDEDLPPADGLILIDGHTGYAAKGLTDLGPQIVDEEDGRIRNPELDMLNPENGFNEPPEPSNYSDEFLERFFQGQADRMNRLIERNLGRYEQMQESSARYPDDEEFMFLDNRSRVFRPDPSILAHTRWRHKVLHAADSEVGEGVNVEQVDSIRGVDTPDYTPPFTWTGRETEPSTVRTWLGLRAIRPTEDYKLTADSIEGIDWNSANAQTPGNLKDISVPLLITQTTGHRFVVHGELFYNHAGMNDKTLLYIEGGDHSFNPLDAKYGDTRRAVINAWNQWTEKRFV